MQCNAELCEKEAKAAGSCKGHYYQMQRYGHFLTPEEKKAHYAKKPGVRLNTGRTHFRKGISSWNKGLPDWMTPEHKAKIGFKKGIEPWNKDKNWTERQGENNHMWVGDEVKYRPLHQWVQRHLGKPTTCVNCEITGLTGHEIHWANISHEYKRDIDDWIRLCAKCHGAYDSGKLTMAEMRISQLQLQYQINLE